MKTLTQQSIKQLDTTDLIPHPDNPRVHSKAQIKQIAKSIKSFGFKIPILVDGNHQIIAGHGRVEAAKLLDITTVPTVVANDLTSAQSRALMIADNKLTENAAWDDQLLSNNFQILNDLDLNFDLDVTGFDYGEIEQLLILDDPVPESQESLPVIDESLPIVSQLGDRWQLGKHSILCGNSLDTDVYKALLGKHKAQLIFSDPPYNLPSSTIGKVCEKQHGNFQFAGGEMSQEAFIKFLITVFSHCRDFSDDGSIHYHCMDWRHLPDITKAGLSIYDELKNICVWVKDRAGMGSFYRSQHEMILVFKQGQSNHQNHFKLGQHGRYRTNVWSYPAVRMVDDTGNDEIISFLKGRRAPYLKLTEKSLFAQVADLLANGHVVGWFQGRMELGPRALGARSIIGDPRNAEMQKTMNLKIKFRESFRPFAPVVLAENSQDYFDMTQHSPYMLTVSSVLDKWLSKTEFRGLGSINEVRSELPAITHVDNSARVQTVHDETNPRFAGLLRAFREKTGCPVLVNTSFNVRGEPVVRSPEEAYTCFMRTNMDVLVLNNFVLRKDEQPPLENDIDWRKEIALD